MIHLDRNHHTSPLVEKQNLILQNSNHNILSWRDDHNYNNYQVHPNSPTHHQPPPPSSSSSSLPGPITPVNAEDPVLSQLSAPSSPSSPADELPTSPAREKSSSLSPIPETSTNAASPPLSSSHPQHEHQQHEPRKEEEEEEEAQPLTSKESPSRQSTPLSDLSPPPEQDGTGDDKETTPEQDTDIKPEVAPQEVPKTELDQPQPVTKEEPLGDTDMPTNAAMDASTSESLSPPHSSQPAPSSSETEPGSSSDVARAHQNAVTSTSSSSSKSLSSPTYPSTPRSASLPRSASSPTRPHESKVVSILELNAELLKVSMDFQTRGIPMTDSRFHQLKTRLESNLAWLAAAADQRRPGSNNNFSLPVMEPLQSAGFTSIDRIQQIYADLPSLFAKDIARRQAAVAAANAGTSPASSSTLGNPNLKRERMEDPIADLSAKRQNTGDHKNLSMLPPSLPPQQQQQQQQQQNSHHSSPSSSSSSMPFGMSNGIGGGGIPPQSPQMNIGGNNGSPMGMAPPMMHPGISMSAADAQVAASNRDRARQIQIRQAVQMQQQQQAQQHHQQQAQQHHQQQQSGRQMSPQQMSPLANGISGAQNPQMGGQGQHNAVAGPSSMQMPIQSNPNININNSNNNGNNGGGNSGSNNTNNPSINAAIAALGPHAMQNFQMLQNPGHPFVQYMISLVPGFATLPLQQQMQKMQGVQAALQSKQQQQLAAQQHQRGGMGMQGMPNMGVNGMGGGQGGSQMSSMANSSPMVQQTQMHSPQNSAFPMGGGGGGGGGMVNGMMDPRAGLSSQLPGGLNMGNMTPQQRQMILQQQMMRQGGANPNPAMMNSQQAFLIQQERMRIAHSQQQQAGSPPHMSSPMSLPGNDSFPALRSNPSVQGIARSTRSPSDNAPSPMTPRVPSRAASMTQQEDYQRALLQQQAQARAMVAQQQQNSGFNPQMHLAQQQQQQSMQLSHATQGSYGVPSPGSGAGQGAGSYGSVPSPTGSQHNWSQGGAGGAAHYPFASPPGSAAHQNFQPERSRTPRHLSPSSSSTPAPQQMQNLAQPGDTPSDYDIFNWGQ